MKRRSMYAVAALLCLFLSVNGYAQGTSNSTVGGTVADATGALIPGVSVTATNTGTGIANTVVTNESGAYNFASLQPGTYKVHAELPGFQTQTYTDVQIGGAQQVRLNFTLQVGAAAGQTVDVTISADTALATSSSVLSTVIPEYKIRDLPTIAGWWTGADIDEKQSLGRLTADDAQSARTERVREKQAMADALGRAGVAGDAPADGAALHDAAITAAIHRYVCATPATLVLIQADDLAGETVALNLPGTDRERPNWRRKVSVDVDALWKTRPAIQAIADFGLAGRAVPTAVPPAPHDEHALGTDVPRS